MIDLAQEARFEPFPFTQKIQISPLSTRTSHSRHPCVTIRVRNLGSIFRGIIWVISSALVVLYVAFCTHAPSNNIYHRFAEIPNFSRPRPPGGEIVRLKDKPSTNPSSRSSYHHLYILVGTESKWSEKSIPEGKVQILLACPDYQKSTPPPSRSSNSKN